MDEVKPVAVSAPSDTLGIASLICGILGVLLFLCCSYLSVILGIAALICGILAGQQQQKYATAGIILGALSIVLGVIFAIIGRFIFSEIFDVLRYEMMGMF